MICGTTALLKFETRLEGAKAINESAEEGAATGMLGRHGPLIGCVAG